MDLMNELDALIARARGTAEALEAAKQKILGEAPTAKPKRPKPGPKPGGKRRRKRAGGTRADHALALIEKTPGIGASVIAAELNIKPNYLYRVLGDMEKEGRVRKDGRAYYPATAGNEID